MYFYCIRLQINKHVCLSVYRYVPPQRVWFLSRFGLKTGIDFDNYVLKSGRVLGAENIYESLQTYFSSQYVTGTTNW